MYCQLRMALELYKTARGRRSSADINDDTLADLVNESRELEKRLDAEKIRYADLVKSELVVSAYLFAHLAYGVG